MRIYMRFFLLLAWFINLFCSSQMELSFLEDLIFFLKNGKPFIYTKFGDGEYNCMNGMSGANCDNDPYDAWKGTRLKKSFVNLVQRNAYIGKWKTQYSAPVIAFLQNLAKKHSIGPVNWVHYHILINYDYGKGAESFMKDSYLYSFVETIQALTKKKIIVSNHRNRRLKDFFHADVFIEIPEREWSKHYDMWKGHIERHMTSDVILLIAGGMCSKILISDLAHKFDATFIDIGSCFDLIAGKRNSRGWAHSYADELLYYKNILPSNWDA